MDDQRRETTDYEPNFILKDPEEETPEISGEPAGGQDGPDPAEFTRNYQRTIDPEYTQAFERPGDPGAPDLPKEPRDLSETQPIGNAPYFDVPKDAGGSSAASETAADEAAADETESLEAHVFAKDTAADDTESLEAHVFAKDTAADNTAADETVDLRGNAHSEDASREAGSGAPPIYGAFRDPRENFGQRTAAESRAGASHGNVYNNFESSGGYEPPKPPKAHRAPKPKKQPQPVTLTRKSLALLMAAMMVIAILFGGGSSILANNLLDKDTQAANSGSVGKDSSYTLEDATASKMSISEITAKTRSSVVEIRTESVVSDSWMQQYVAEGAGSGVIITEDGYIMTNNHVIEGARKITVTTTDNQEYQASLIGADPNNDVAIIKVDAEGLTAATYGNSDQLQVGDLAVAIGNPLGELGGTVTSGIISALDRELTIDGKTLRLLQTDSSINPGNSGGGLFNDSGQLIGIVVAKSSGSGVEGLGFAIPINTAASVAEQLMDKGYVSGQPYTGMGYQEASSGMTDEDMGGFGELFGWGEGTSGSTSVYIVEVSGKNAKAAGFREGDMVYAVDGKVITTFDELTAAITAKKPGDEITYTIVRDGMTQDITFELEEKTN